MVPSTPVNPNEGPSSHSHANIAVAAQTNDVHNKLFKHILESQDLETKAREVKNAQQDLEIARLKHDQEIHERQQQMTEKEVAHQKRIQAEDAARLGKQIGGLGSRMDGLENTVEKMKSTSKKDRKKTKEAIGILVDNMDLSPTTRGKLRFSDSSFESAASTQNDKCHDGEENTSLQPPLRKGDTKENKDHLLAGIEASKKGGDKGMSLHLHIVYTITFPFRSDKKLTPSSLLHIKSWNSSARE